MVMKNSAYLSLSLVLAGSGIMDSDDITRLPGRDLARFPSGVWKTNVSHEYLYVSSVQQKMSTNS